tara:strand:+ start:409 stop:588 length:180 start_codon:yes stop_codon:yes gene_type:complete
MQNNYIGEVIEGEDGETMIQLPIELLGSMGWDEQTLLEWIIEEETIVLKETENVRETKT